MGSEKFSQQDRYIFRLGALESKSASIIEQWRKNDFLQRLWKKDAKLWFSQKTPEITNRLGWLNLPETLPDRLDEFRSLAEYVKQAGINQVILLGMGGSSLAPEVFKKTFSNAEGFPEFRILDSTHPESIIHMEKDLDYSETFFVVSSKSGTTVETRSFFQYFWDQCSRKIKNSGNHFAAVTDSGTPLESIGKNKDFKGIFLPPEDVGGRYSAFTDFGMLPAALMGADAERLLEQGRTAAKLNKADREPEKAPAIALGAVLGAAAEKHNKITIWASPSLSSFPDWLEQLIAESTGKNGRGLIPVVHEPAVNPDRYSRDRMFVFFHYQKDTDKDIVHLFDQLVQAGHPGVIIPLKDKYELGREIFNWELSVAAAGAAMGIHPFNQPDVQLAKERAKKAMQETGEKKKPGRENEYSLDEESRLQKALRQWLSRIIRGDYLGIQAYLPDKPETAAALQTLQEKLLCASGVPVTVGFGPRFLHSTGQLHKGGPNQGLFLQLVDEPETDIAIPDSGCTFGQLIKAQALGDFQALTERKRRVLRINLKDTGIHGIQRIIDFIQD